MSYDPSLVVLIPNVTIHLSGFFCPLPCPPTPPMTWTPPARSSSKRPHVTTSNLIHVPPGAAQLLDTAPILNGLQYIGKFCTDGEQCKYRYSPDWPPA